MRKRTGGPTRGPRSKEQRVCGHVDYRETGGFIRGPGETPMIESRSSSFKWQGVCFHAPVGYRGSGVGRLLQPFCLVSSQALIICLFDQIKLTSKKKIPWDHSLVVRTTPSLLVKVVAFSEFNFVSLHCIVFQQKIN